MRISEVMVVKRLILNRSASTLAIIFCVSFSTSLEVEPLFAKLIARAANVPETAQEEHRMRQRNDMTYLEMLQVADSILLDDVNTSQSMVSDRRIEFSARHITGFLLVSASAIFFCPGIH